MEEQVWNQFDIGQTVFPDGIQKDNYVKTTRYTVLTFLPLTLYENFQRLANIYFLLITILVLFPWTPVSPIVQITPLIFVIAVSMVKALIEDLFRLQNDKKTNAVKFEVFRDGLFVRTRSSEIRPGDIVKLPSGIETPCDLLLISSSEDSKMCFVNEVNLNGETAVKQRRSISAFKDLTFPSDARQISGSIRIPMPCKDLRALDGQLTYGDKVEAFSMRNCVLRGTIVAHTEWVIGISLYTGHDTRIIQNQRHPPHKTSHLDHRLNVIILIVFIVNFALVILSSVMAITKEKNFQFTWAGTQSASAFHFFEHFTSFTIIYSYMIPISLYVTLEFVRFFQRWTFSSDLGMYYPGLGFCQPNNSNLNEELGQVEHIFSDKTGTLTENIMKFVQISARGNLYDIVQDTEHVKSLVGKDRDLTEILSCIAVCHSVIISGESYSSESPDEEALVTTAATLGAKFVERVPDTSITIELGGKTSVFQHLATVDFDSDRKRMSVIVRAPNGQIVLYTKGADTIMMKLFSQDEDPAIVQHLAEQVDALAEEGLRTLVCGWRLISEEEWQNLKERLDAANLEMVDRDKKIKEVGGTVEHDLILLGAVAIEDQLQPNVPETMSYLSQMGIKLWILTGDKHETAVSIARSTNVITPQSKVFECLTRDPEEHQRVYCELANYEECVLVLSPDSLETLAEETPEMLVKLGEKCRSVICFRMSPYMKSKVVEVMMTHTKKVCLAIGDGANDVNMIQTANVGVGIIGREGRQAAQNSDFAISRFRHLKRLLAVHGRLSLVRLSGTIRYMIYKNLVFTFPQLWFFFFTNWSPTTIFEGFLLATYNLIWTLFPPGEYGFFEQDISFLSMMKYPFIYKETRSGRYLSWWRFILEAMNAIYQSLVLFYFNVYHMCNKIISNKGMTDSFMVSGFQLYMGIVMVVDLQTINRSHHWNVFLFLGVVVSILIFFLVGLPYGSFAQWVPGMYYVPQVLFTNALPYPTVLLSIILCLAPEAIACFLKGMWFPSFTRIVREGELIEQQRQRRR